MVMGSEYSKVQREQLLKTENEWVVQFDIINHEGREQEYTIEALGGGEKYRGSVTILEGQVYTFIRHIRRDQTGDGPVSFAVYRSNEEKPFKKVTYYLEWSQEEAGYRQWKKIEESYISS